MKKSPLQFMVSLVEEDTDDDHSTVGTTQGLIAYGMAIRFARTFNKELPENFGKVSLEKGRFLMRVSKDPCWGASLVHEVVRQIGDQDLEERVDWLGDALSLCEGVWAVSPDERSEGRDLLEAIIADLDYVDFPTEEVERERELFGEATPYNVEITDVPLPEVLKSLHCI